MVVKKQVASADFSKVAKNIENINLEDEVENSFLAYSYMVILSRAIPDARDGMKPVHRRVLWSMYEDGYTPDKNHVKSAKIVGAVTGNYHTFGDSACYEAMVRLAQDYSLSVPLIDPHGNFGSGPGSSAAASRYTEARISKEALGLLAELKENGAEMKPNYDATRQEPIVLPVRFPNLIINGGSGIAVGMASKMAPHNPGEVMDAARWLLTHPTASLERLMEFVPGPDFPTGARILGVDAIKEAYETGRGTIRIQSKYTIESQARGKNHILFTELPYEISSESIIEGMKKHIREGKLQGVADIKDLTDRLNGTRLVVETKAGINPQALVSELMKLTNLEVSFGINNVAIVNGEPKTLGLKEQLEIFINHRIDIVTRRTSFRKNKKDARLHIVEGLLKALANIDAVIKIVRNAVDTSIAREQLIAKFKLDDIQANFILDLQLRRLTKYDQIELQSEKQKLTDELVDLNKILNDEKELRLLIGQELEETRKQIERPRRSVIVDGNLAEHLEAAKEAAQSVNLEVEDGPCGIFLTPKGSIVRSDKLKLTKPVLSAIESTVRGKFIIVTSKGRAFRVDSLHVGTKEAPISNILPAKLEAGEKVVALASTDLAEGKVGGIAIGTKNGNVKITSPIWPVRSDDFSVIKLEGDDEIITARWVEDADKYDLVFISTDTSLLTFPASKVRPQGLSGGGMAGIKLADGATVSSFSVISADEKPTALVVTHTGKSIKATPFVLYPAKGRATGGVRSMKFLKGETELVLSTVNGSGNLFTAQGNIVPLPKIDSRRDGSGIAVKADELF